MPFKGFDTNAELGLELLGLVLDMDDGLVVVGGDVGVGDAWLCYHDNDASTLGGIYGTFNTHLFDGIAGVTDAGCVNEAEGDAPQLYSIFNGVACGTLYVADNSPFFVKKGV